jgi:hypothetical protein
LVNLDAVKARDLVIQCFMAAQRATFAETKEQAGLEVDEDALERSVVAAVRVAFRKAGGDFDNPTKASIMAAIDQLATTAAGWGTPEPIILYHRCEIEKILDSLDD